MSADLGSRIRRGKIRILIDDGSGNPVPVGPIQLSSADSIEELQERVYLVQPVAAGGCVKNSKGCKL